MILLLLVESPGFKILEYRLAYELPGALEVQPQRLLERDPEEPKTLQLPSLLR